MRSLHGNLGDLSTSLLGSLINYLRVGSSPVLVTKKLVLSNHKALLLLHLAKSLPTTNEACLKAVVLIDYKFGKSIIKAL